MRALLPLLFGDFFEVWVGDDYVSELSAAVAKQLKAVSNSGIPIYFVHGNRDFIMRTKYADMAGMTLLDEQTVIDLYGTPTVILHGDEMCTQDIEYQKFRQKSRGWWWPKLMLAMPLCTCGKESRISFFPNPFSCALGNTASCSSSKTASGLNPLF